MAEHLLLQELSTEEYLSNQYKTSGRETSSINQSEITKKSRNYLHAFDLKKSLAHSKEEEPAIAVEGTKFSTKTDRGEVLL